MPRIFGMSMFKVCTIGSSSSVSPKVLSEISVEFQMQALTIEKYLCNPICLSFTHLSVSLSVFIPGLTAQ